MEVVTDVHDADDGDTHEADTHEDSPDDIAVAKALFNWKPRDEYEGDPKRWRTAADMARHGKKLVSESRSKHGEAMRANQRLNEVSDQFRRLEARLNTADAREIEERMDAAFQSGDNAGYQAAKRELQQLRNARSMEHEPVDPAPFATFKEENADWFSVRRNANGSFTPLGEHKEAVAYAVSLGPLLAQEYGGDTPELYAEIRKRTARRFPEINNEREPEQRRASPRQPSTGAPTGGVRERIPGKITAASLTPKQRDAARQFGKTDEQWAKVLTEQNEKERA